jgi:hypothetical protein
MRFSAGLAKGLTVLLALTACSQPSESTPRPQPSDHERASLQITADGEPGVRVTGSDQFEVRGHDAVAVDLATLSSGDATVVYGPSRDLPRAIEFPKYVRSGTYPLAVVKVTPTSGQALDPENAEFRFAAVFRLDSTSSGRRIDDGDNVFQRGLASDASMFKLEIGRDRPACTVKGSAGEVSVRSETAVRPGGWYRATCTRRSDGLAITVKPYESGASPTTAATSGPTGRLTFSPGQSASIGGKLYKSGEVVADASDQFNGAVALVKFRHF